MPAVVPVALRPSTPADADFDYRLYASTRAEELARTGWEAEATEAFLRTQYDAQTRSYRANHPGASFDVILVEGRPAGRLYVDRGTEVIHVIAIALLPEHRGGGIGTLLLAELLDEAATRGRRVTLSVERSNPARRLYERLGFRAVRGDEVYLDLEWSPPPRAVPGPG